MAQKYQSWDRNNPDMQNAVRLTPYYVLLTEKAPEVIEVMDLNPQVLAYLQSYNVINKGKCQEIQAATANQKMVYELLNHIGMGAVWKFHALVRVLQVSGQEHVVRLLDLEPEQYGDETTSLMEERRDKDEGDDKQSTQKMDLVEEGKRANQPKTQNQKGNPNTASPSNPESQAALQDVQQPASYCRKSPRFWCLLTTALASVIIIPLIIVIVLFTPGTQNTAGPSAIPTDSENAGTTTSSSDGRETSQLPTPQTTETSESLTNATILMNCERLSEDMESLFSRLCWIDEETLIVTSLTSKRLLKYTVNTEAKDCHGEVIDSGYEVNDASCSADRRVYITYLKKSRVQVEVRILDLQNKRSQIWYPGFSCERGSVSIAVNDQFIVISCGSENYVYNKDKVLKYKIDHTDVSESFMHTYLTTDNVFFGTVYEGFKLLILNLLTKVTYINEDGVQQAYVVTGTRDGYVFVERYPFFGMGLNINNFGVYSLRGTFLNLIQIEKPKEGVLHRNAAIRNNDGKTFIAFESGAPHPILIYSIHGGVNRS